MLTFVPLPPTMLVKYDTHFVSSLQEVYGRSLTFIGRTYGWHCLR